MKFLVDNILVCPDDGASAIRKKVAERLGAHVQKLHVEVVSRRWVRTEEGGSISLTVIAETNEFLRSTSSFSRPAEITLNSTPLEWKQNPVVVGFGLSGMIAALYLAKRGLRPLVLERKAPFEDKPLPRVRKTALLKEKENGSPTKFGSLLLLNNLDPRLKVLLEEEGIKFEGPDSQRFLDPSALGSIMTSLREKIVSYGGEIRFGATYLGTKKRFGKTRGVLFEEGGVEKLFKTNKILLANGAYDDAYFLGASVPTLVQTFNEIVYGKKVIDSRYPLYLAKQMGKGQGAKPLLITGLKGVRVIDAGTEEERCVQAYAFDGKGKHVHSFIGVEISAEEAEKVCKNAFDANKPGKIPCSSVADFYAKRTPLRLGLIKPEKTSDIRLENFSKILGANLAKRFVGAIGQFAKTYPYLEGKDSILEGLFLLSGCHDGHPKRIDGLCVCCIPAAASFDFASKATAGFKAALLLCE